MLTFRVKGSHGSYYGIWTGGGTAPADGVYFPTSALATSFKFYFSSFAVSSGTSLGAVRWGHGAAGNSTTGIFAGGYSGAAALSTTEKYTFASGAMANGGALGGTTAGNAGCGTATIGYFGGGNSTPTTITAYTNALGTVHKYTYGSDSSAAGTVLSVGQGYPAAVGSTTKGIFAGGNGEYSAGGAPAFVNSWGSDKTQKYTYSGDTVAVSTSLVDKRIGSSGVGNGTAGYIVGSRPYYTGSGFTYEPWSVATDKYTYSGDTVASSTDLDYSLGFSGACGTSLFGVIAGTADSATREGPVYQSTGSTNIINYSDDSTSTTTILEVKRGWFAACSPYNGGL